MLSKVINIYKLPLLISITLSVILLALSVAREPEQIAAIVFGAILGTFLLDLDYYIHAYFFDKENEFSANLKSFIKDKDYLNALNYIQHNKHLLREKTLNSVIFQVAIAVLGYFVIASHGHIFIQAFILSAYVNSLYRYAELYFTKQDPSLWFWVLKDKPTPEGLKIYGMALIATLIFLLAAF